MARINMEQVKKIAELLKELPESERGLNFYSFGEGKDEIIAAHLYPELNHPQAINFFFFGCMLNYGFWHGDKKGYKEPLFGHINGKKLKGSELLFAACKKALEKDFYIFEPENLAEITYDELFQNILADDNGPINFPDKKMRFWLTRQFGKWFVERNMSPPDIIDIVGDSLEALMEFLELTQMIPGYNKDHLLKKNLLLAMALANRPEEFLWVTDEHNWRPIIDYHILRTALRTGMLELEESELKQNIEREWVNAKTENDYRDKTYVIVLHLMALTGRSMFMIDKNLWMARKFCPEMEEPDCSKCIFNSVCKKNTELFQPIYRTTNY